MKIVAEIGGSHGQVYDRAHRLINVAKACGADYVKFQTIELDHMAADVRVKSGPWAGQRYRDLYASTALPWAWHVDLFEHARAIGIEPFSTPFSENAVDFLETLDCSIYKIASPEITHLDLIQHAAATGKLMIISTGMASMREIDEAVSTVSKVADVSDLMLMVCVSEYPALVSDYRLYLIDKFQKRYGCFVGVSDHTQGTALPIISVAKKVGMLERHLTVTTHLPDDVFATSATCFKDVVAAVRTAEEALTPKAPADLGSLEYRRCVWVVSPMKAGDQFTNQNVRVLRPWLKGGIEPSAMVSLITREKRAIRGLEPNTPLMWSDVDGTTT